MKPPLAPPRNMSAIIDRRRYSTQKSSLIASDDYWDGNGFTRGGRNHFLYRTPKGAYFLVTLTLWEGERDTLRPISQEEAIELYERALCNHHVKYNQAFPDVTVEDA